MNTFTITPAGLDFTPIFIVLAVVGVFAVIFVIGLIFDILPMWLIGLYFGLIALVSGAIMGPTYTFAEIPEDDRIAQQVEGIESLGYDNVELSGEFFTASDEDGKYVSGVLVNLGDDTYTVLETKGATK